MASLLWALLVTIAMLSAHQHKSQALVIDATPASIQTTSEPNTVCIHVLTPNVIRRRKGEVNHT